MVELVNARGDGLGMAKCSPALLGERRMPDVPEHKSEPDGAAARAVAICILFTATLALVGCWTTPVANVQPKGSPRLIQSGIAVRPVKERVIVRSIETESRTIVVVSAAHPQPIAYVLGPRVSNFDRIKAGDAVEVTVARELAVYVLNGDQLPGPGGVNESIAVTARVLSVDPSYRLLAVQYPDGQHETFKPGLEAKLEEMEPGDSVVIRAREIVAVRILKT
jgi:hypothetical protein